MRRQTELRTVSGEEKGRTALKSVKSGTVESVPATTVERRIFSTINDVERMMEEALHRPFFGLSTLPIRHLFHDLGSFGEFTPAVDIFEEKGEVVVKAELPGMKKDNISVKVVGNDIIINGEKKTEEKVERKDYLRVERSHGSFNRTVSLPEGCDTEHAKASFKDGVLEVRLPRTGRKGFERQINVV
jgi:HSP20 family protein